MDKKKELKEMNRVILAKKLHTALDILLAGFITYTKGAVMELTIQELLNWSYQQTFVKNNSEEQENG